MKPLPLPVRIAAGLAATAIERARDLPTILTGLPVTVASQALQMTMRVQQHVTELAIKGDEALASLRPVEEKPEWATFDEDIESDDDGHDGYGAYTPARFDQVELDDEPDDPWELEEQALEATFDEDEAEEDGTGEAAIPSPRGQGAWDATPDEAAGTDGADEAAEDTGAGATDLDADGLDAADDVTGASDEAPTSTGPDPAGDAGSDPAAGPTSAPAGLANYAELSLPQLRARLRGFSLADLQDILAHERAHENRPAFVGMLSRRIETVRAQS